jgi:hypothetical protein
VLFPSVTRAKDLFPAGDVLADASILHNVIGIPEDLSVLDPEQRKAVDRFSKRVKSSGTDDRYVAQNRRA